MLTDKEIFVEEIRLERERRHDPTGMTFLVQKLPRMQEEEHKMAAV
jgi:hypothetical protein